MRRRVWLDPPRPLGRCADATPGAGGLQSGEIDARWAAYVWFAPPVRRGRL